MQLSLEKRTLQPRVREEIRYIADMPISEEQGEGPHAVFNREVHRCPAAMRPWRAASSRVKSSLDVYGGFTTNQRRAFADEWWGWRRALQVSKTDVGRAKKMS